MGEYCSPPPPPSFDVILSENDVVGCQFTSTLTEPASLFFQWWSVDGEWKLSHRMRIDVAGGGA